MILVCADFQRVGSLYTASLQAGGNMRIFSDNLKFIGNIGDAANAGLARIRFYWPLSWRNASALILGALLAKWFWILFAPQPTYTASMPARTASAGASRLFGVAPTNQTTAEGVALPNVQLLGIFSASSDKPGFAVLKLDNNRQMGVAEGEEVVPGTRMIAVEADYVLLERAGARQRVNLENKFENSNKAGHLPDYGMAASRQQNVNPPDMILQNSMHRQRK